MANIFKNMTIGGRFFIASLLIVAVLFTIGWQSVSTIIECHHACMLLLNGALNTKSLAQSSQASYYMVTEYAGNSLVYAQLGDGTKSETMKTQFTTEAQSMIAGLNTVLEKG